MHAWARVFAAVLVLAAAAALSAAAFAAGERDTILAGLLAQAKAADPALAGFSAERGAAFYRAKHAGGGEDTPSCTSCHGDNPKAPGQTRAGKAIEPLAVSVTPARFTEPAKVEKWFLRNCKGVLGRECTAQEKGDFIAFLAAQ